jgi:hypothetical protein
MMLSTKQALKYSCSDELTIRLAVGIERDSVAIIWHFMASSGES